MVLLIWCRSSLSFKAFVTSDKQYHRYSAKRQGDNSLPNPQSVLFFFFLKEGWLTCELPVPRECCRHT